jgi:hypothetical protein
LKAKNNLKKHWTIGSGWGIVKAMHDIIFTFIKTIMQGAKFFFVNNGQPTMDQCPCLYHKRLASISNLTNLGMCGNGCN